MWSLNRQNSLASRLASPTCPPLDDNWPMTDAVVGRSFERASLQALLDVVSSGHGRGAILLGDAGIGKTTLATALASVVTAGP